MEYTMYEEQAVLRVRAWGRDTPRMPAPACAAILGEVQRLGLKRILVELEQKVPLSGTSQYEMIDRMPTLGITPQHPGPVRSERPARNRRRQPRPECEELPRSRRRPRLAGVNLRA
jgi:hypothetical protein